MLHWVAYVQFRVLHVPYHMCYMCGIGCYMCDITCVTCAISGVTCATSGVKLYRMQSWGSGLEKKLFSIKRYISIESKSTQMHLHSRECPPRQKENGNNILKFFLNNT